MNIFKYLNYREILTELIEERRKGDRRWSFQGLAEAIRVPKSYMSRVVHGDADLSHDQLYLACEYFDLTRDEAHYLDVLLQYERCGLESRKALLREVMVKLQRRFLDPGRVLKNEINEGRIPLQTEYYLNPLHQIVHSALTIPQFQKNVASLASTLQLSRERLNDAIHKLERMGLCERNGDEARSIDLSVHLPKDSPIAAAWQNQLRLMSMQRMQSLPREEFFSYSVVFSADRLMDNDIRQKFLAFLSAIQSDSHDRPNEKVYQLNFDLVPWTI